MSVYVSCEWLYTNDKVNYKEYKYNFFSFVYSN